MTPPEDLSFTDPGLWLSQRPVTVTVRGVSMEPFLKEGDRVEVVLAERSSFGRGDLVLFQRAGEVVVHRFLQEREGRFLEKGDGQARGNWAEWPSSPGLVTALWRGAQRVDLARPPWPSQMASLGRTHLRAHRVALAAERLPGSLPGRVLLGLARRLGLLPA